MDGAEDRAGRIFRISGTTLTGTVLKYDERTEPFVLKNGRTVREMFKPGAFAPIPDVPLVVGHDDTLPIAKPGRFALNDSERELTIRAELGPKSAALELVKNGSLNGYSFRFWPIAERMEGSTRIVEKARLGHVGLVPEGQYPSSLAEVRARGARGGRLGTLRGRVPANRKLQCRCQPGDCESALFEAGSFDGLTKQQAADLQGDVLAVIGDYKNGIGSAKRRNVRFWAGKDGSLEYAIDIPNTERGKALLENMENIPHYGRPVIDVPASKFARKGPVAEYSEAKVRAITVGPTDASIGWTALTLGDDGEDAPDDDKPKRAPRRRQTWLP